MSITVRPSHPFGALMREWRQRRHLSQLALALRSNISQRHLSFVESGRAEPSREMVLRLAEQLDVPLRERNRFLLAAGYAPLFHERPLADPALDAARSAVTRVLAGHEPFPALAVDRHWNLVEANRAMLHFVSGASPRLLEHPMNVLRLSLHPEGLAPRIVNLPEWRGHLLSRLARQVEQAADATLAGLLAELRELPLPLARGRGPEPSHEDPGVIIPLQLRGEAGELLSFIGTTTVFGTPTEVTIAELAMECFFPADATTTAYLRQLADGS